MQKIKLLIFGSKGWIGNQFIEYLNANKDENITYMETNVRADNEQLVTDVIMAHSPTHIISFIGRTYGGDFNTIDYLEQPGKLTDNVRDNLYAPMVLANLSYKFNIHYTYLGTGCIFSQEDPTKKSYMETDNPDFFGSSYSTVKGFTDRLMRLYPNTLNLRIRMPIVDFEHPRNFITKITQYEKICSMPNSMTVLPDFYPIILDMQENTCPASKMMKNKETGTMNLVNPGLITHNEILEMYKEIVNPDFTWSNFSIEEQNQILKSKRSNNHLNTSKLEKLYPSILPIHYSVRNCLLKYKKS